MNIRFHAFPYLTSLSYFAYPSTTDVILNHIITYLFIITFIAYLPKLQKKNNEIVFECSNKEKIPQQKYFLFFKNSKSKDVPVLQLKSNNSKRCYYIKGSWLNVKYIST